MKNLFHGHELIAKRAVESLFSVYFVVSRSSSNGLRWVEEKKWNFALNLLNKTTQAEESELVERKKNKDEKYRVLRSVATLCNFFYSCSPRFTLNLLMAVALYRINFFSVVLRRRKNEKNLTELYRKKARSKWKHEENFWKSSENVQQMIQTREKLLKPFQFFWSCIFPPLTIFSTFSDRSNLKSWKRLW